MSAIRIFGKRLNIKLILSGICLIVAITAIFYFFVRIYHVDSGYVGVKSTINNPFDDADAYHASTINGYGIYVPLLTNIKIYPTSVFSCRIDSIQLYSKEGVGFIASPIVLLQLDVSKVSDYYKNFKEDLDENTLIKEVIINSFVGVTNGYSADSLINNQKEYEEVLFKNLSYNLKSSYFVFLKNLNTNFKYPVEIKDNIDLKLKIQQEILVAKTEADLTFIQADIKRKKDSLEYSSLSKLSIQKLFIDKWDGRLAPNPGQPIMYQEINKDSITNSSN